MDRLCARGPLVALVAVGLALACGDAAYAQRQQQQRPPMQTWDQLRDIDFEGQIAGFQGANIISANAVGEPVLIVPVPGPMSQIMVRGTADASVLGPQLWVRFTGTVNDELMVEEPVEMLEWFSPYQGQTFEPVVLNTEGEIAGRILRYVDGTMEMQVTGPNRARKKISVPVDPGAQITVAVSDLKVAAGQEGASLKMSGKRLNDHQLFAVRLEIELSQPLTAPERGRRAR